LIVSYCNIMSTVGLHSAKTLLYDYTSPSRGVSLPCALLKTRLCSELGICDFSM
jgi:hypothetical protein